MHNRVILGGDAFSDAFRGLYDQKMYWNLTDPDYCVGVMRGAYEGGCRAFDFSFGPVREMFEALGASVDEEIVGVANPTWLQGCKLEGKHLQYLRSRVLRTFTAREGFWPPDLARRVREDLRVNTCMVFGFDPEAEPLSDGEIGRLYLDEDVFLARLEELRGGRYVLIGGTDADWLFTLGREDLIARMAALVHAAGRIPLLICHYASTVLPRADAMGLDVEGYFAPINRSWGWFTQEAAAEAVRRARRPVTAFMAFACGGLCQTMEEAALYLRDRCGVRGILYGTTKAKNARATAEMLRRVFG